MRTLTALILALSLFACGPGLTLKSHRIGGAPGAISDPDSGDNYLVMEYTLPGGAESVKFQLADQHNATIREWLRPRTHADVQQVELKLDRMKGEPLEPGSYTMRIIALDADTRPVATISQSITIR